MFVAYILLRIYTFSDDDRMLISISPYTYARTLLPMGQWLDEFEDGEFGRHIPSSNIKTEDGEIIVAVFTLTGNLRIPPSPISPSNFIDNIKTAILNKITF